MLFALVAGRGDGALAVRAAGPPGGAGGRRHRRPPAPPRRRHRPRARVHLRHRRARLRHRRPRASRRPAARSRSSPCSSSASRCCPPARRPDRGLGHPIAPAPARVGGDGFGSGLLLGASLGLVYTPCAGPILAGVITVSAAQDFTAGKLAVALAYAVGSGAVLYAAHARRAPARRPLRPYGPGSRSRSAP